MSDALTAFDTLLAALKRAREALYNGFEPENQSRAYHDVDDHIKAAARARALFTQSESASSGASSALADELDRIAAQEELDLRYGTEATNRNTKPLRDAAKAIRSANTSIDFNRGLHEAKIACMGQIVGTGPQDHETDRAHDRAVEQCVKAIAKLEQIDVPDRKATK